MQITHWKSCHHARQLGIKCASTKWKGGRNFKPGTPGFRNEQHDAETTNGRAVRCLGACHNLLRSLQQFGEAANKVNRWNKPLYPPLLLRKNNCGGTHEEQEIIEDIARRICKRWSERSCSPTYAFVNKLGDCATENTAEWLTIIVLKFSGWKRTELSTCAGMKCYTKGTHGDSVSKATQLETEDRISLLVEQNHNLHTRL